jgi:hypothetical protein
MVDRDTVVDGDDLSLELIVRADFHRTAFQQPASGSLLSSPRRTRPPDSGIPAYPPFGDVVDCTVSTADKLK